MTDTSGDNRVFSARDDEQLQELLDRWEAAYELGDRLSVKQLCGDDSDLAPALQEQIDALLDVGLFVGDWEAGGVAASPKRIGPYRVLGELGRGGSAVVYLCEAAHSQRKVALKILQPARAEGKLGERFRREIQLLATLNHPGIAQIHDAGIANLGQGPQPYFTMEWIQGQRLDEFVRSRGMGSWAIEQSMELLLRVCRAVEFAHDNGIIHRDLKPANILVTEAGQPKVLDFGIARMKSRNGQRHDATTVTQVMVGTPRYMSPEQFAQGSRGVDARSDVYSLGVILYELLTGRPAYEIGSVSIVEVGQIICETSPKPVGSIDRRLRGDLETIVSKSMAKAPDDRYQSVSAFSADVRRYLSGQRIAARRIGPIGQLWRWGRGNPRSAVLGTMAIGTLVFACIVSLHFARLARRQSWNLTAVKLQLEDQVQSLRGSMLNSTLMRASNHVASDPQVAASMLLDERLCPADQRDFAWNVLYRETGRNANQIQAHDGEVVALDVSSDGTTLASAGLDGKLRVWRRDSLEEIASFDMAVGVNTRIALEGDGSRLLAIAADGKLLIATVAGRQIVEERTTRLKKATCVAISSQGRWLAVGDEAGGVRIREADLGGPSLSDPTREFSLGTEPVRALRFGPGGRRLVGVARDGGLCEWDVESGMVASRDKLPMASLRCAAVDAMLRRVVGTRGYDKVLVGYHPAGKIRGNLVQGRVAKQAVRLSASPVAIRSKIGRQEVYAWEGNVRKSTLSVGRANSCRSLALSPRGDYVAVGTRGGTISWLRILPPPGIQVSIEGRNEVVATKFSPSGKLLASAGEDGRVAIHDVQSVPSVGRVLENGSPATDILFSRDGRHLVTADERGLLRLWDVESGGLTRTFAAPGERLAALALSRDGATLFAIATSGSLLVYSMHEGHLIARKEGNGRGGTALAISPDGRTLVSSDGVGNVLLWDTLSLEVTAGFRAHNQCVCSLVFAPDGGMLATGARDHRIRLWQITSSGLKRFETLRFHNAQVTSLDFSPDGSLLASSDRDLRVILWDTANWQPRAVLSDKINWIRTVRFSPDGRLLAMAGNRDYVRLWDGSPAAIRAASR